MLIYGKNAVSEALEQGQAQRVMVALGVRESTVRDIEKLARRAQVPVDRVPRIDLDQALKTTSHQGVVAELPDLDYSAEEAPFELAASRGEKLLLVLLDQVQDPRNYGAIIRSSEVLGAHGVVTEERRSAPLSAVVAKTAAGATAHLPLVQVKNLARFIDDLKSRNVWIYGADAGSRTTPEMIDWDRDAALVMGSEGTGLRRLVREKCDEIVGIPTSGRVSSLNASVAAGIMLYAVQAGRSKGDR
ncbi:MAG TPA: 23S rRNA (guanosine(2251)-2'-O)-methyltransferase RlmB [Trueperaceae bacterium]